MTDNAADLMREAVEQIAEKLEPGQKTQIMIMQTAAPLPTWSTKLTKLGLVAENGLLTELGREVADHLLRSES
jgi:hypothetical protein